MVPTEQDVDGHSRCAPRSAAQKQHNHDNDQYDDYGSNSDVHDTLRGCDNLDGCDKAATVYLIATDLGTKEPTGKA